MATGIVYFLLMLATVASTSVMVEKVNDLVFKKWKNVGVAGKC